MKRDRVTAFTDGVFAVIITIMVIDLRPPHGSSLADLVALWPVLLSYALSYIYVGIYWNNHHHFFHLVDQVEGAVLWSNLNLLFWLSFVPFTTAWMSQNEFAPVPTALYGVSLLMPALAWYVMFRVIVRQQGEGSLLLRAIGRDMKAKISPLLYLAGIGLSFVDVRLADAIYVGVALMWLLPDRRVERAVRETER